MQMYRLLTLAFALTFLCLGCSHVNKTAGPDADVPDVANRTIKQLKTKLAPDAHLAIYDVEIEKRNGALVLIGEVSDAAAKAETARVLEQAGIHATNEIEVLPAKELGDKTWAIASLSVANGREEPEQKAELGTQALMGQAVRVWKRSGRWFLAQTKDGYLSWMERGTLVRSTQSEMENWQRGPLLIVTAFEDQIFEQPNEAALPVSDIVVGDLVKKVGEQADWYQVQLPDDRKGFIHQKTAQDYTAWKQARRPGPEAIERTAKLFLGRPYLWGGNSPKGLDCSGLTKMVFFMNGIDLNRNASHQAKQGTPITLDPDLTRLKKGDLLFFGGRGRREGTPRVSHVAIYLGDKTFIQSSQRVRVSSLDPTSPLYDEQYGRSLIAARRLLNQP
jgi:cell wall-associated NlpC family hydrolase